MTIAWMLCYLLVGTLLLTVALGADRIAAAARWPRRIVLSVVMVAMCILPLLLRQITPLVPVFVYSGKPPEMSATSAPVVMSAVGTSPVAPVEKPTIVFSVSRARGNRVVVSPDSPVLPFDRWALVAWIVAAVAYAGVLLVAYRRMRRARRHWTAAPAHIERSMAALTGVRTRVWCSDGIGPAAFGVIRPAVVIPDWALSLDAEALDLLLRHEASHVTARDPLLLRVALAAVIAMPWNVPLLIAYRRLHRAVEHDCDARVIADTQDARGYARLLLETASRFAGAGAAQAWSRTARWLPAPVPGIGTRRSELELRLRALVQPVSTWRSRVRVIGAGAVVVAALLVACSVPSPERMRSESGVAQARPDRRPFGGVSSARAKYMDEAYVTNPVDSTVNIDVAYVQFQRLMSRGYAATDSAIIAEARRAEPQVFDASRRTDDDVWLLLDDFNHALRSNTGRQYYSINTGQRAETEHSVAATIMTPRLRLIADTHSYARAFPGVQLGEIGMWSSVDVRSGEHLVRILWARYVPRNGAPGSLATHISLSDLFGQSQRSWSFSDAQRQRVNASRDLLLRQMVMDVLPRALDPASHEDPYVWLLIDGAGKVQRHGFGRDGLFAKAKGRFDPAAGTIATRDTPPEDLVFSCGTFRVKFRPLAPRLEPEACGGTAIDAGGRTLNVIWGVTGMRR